MSMNIEFTAQTIAYIEAKVAYNSTSSPDGDFIKYLCQAWRRADVVGNLENQKFEIQNILESYLGEYLDKVLIGNP